MKMTFQKTDGTKVGDYAKYIKEYIENDKLTTSFQIFVGCDSLPKRISGATYVTAICVWKVGHGVHVIFAREHNVLIHGKTERERLKNRLWAEVYRAVDVASALVDGGVMNLRRVDEFEVHLDVNPKKEFESNLIHNDALGYVRALGFDAYAKPDSPAASFASDRACRGKETIGVEK